MSISEEDAGLQGSEVPTPTVPQRGEAVPAEEDAQTLPRKASLLSPSEVRIGVGIGLVLVLGVLLLVWLGSSTPLESAAKTCGAETNLRDDGETLVLNTKGKNDLIGDDMATVRCILRELDTPSSVTEHIWSTRALDGQQVDEWASIKARWIYHPDSGLALTLMIK